MAHVVVVVVVVVVDDAAAAVVEYWNVVETDAPSVEQKNFVVEVGEVQRVEVMRYGCSDC